MSPRLFDPMLEGEPDEYGCGILNAEGLAAVRDFINFCIANGVPPGVSLELLSCYDIGASKNEPQHEPGERHFRLCLPAASPDGTIISIVFTASEKDSDLLWIRPDELLAPVVKTEARIGDLADNVIDLRDRRPVKAIAADIDRVILGVNSDADLLRALHADSKRWLPIGPDAFLFGRLEVFLSPGGEVPA